MRRRKRIATCSNWYLRVLTCSNWYVRVVTCSNWYVRVLLLVIYVYCWSYTYTLVIYVYCRSRQQAAGGRAPNLFELIFEGVHALGELVASRLRLVPARPKGCTSHVRRPLHFPKMMVVTCWNWYLRVSMVARSWSLPTVLGSLVIPRRSLVNPRKSLVIPRRKRIATCSNWYLRVSMVSRSWPLSALLGSTESN